MIGSIEKITKFALNLFFPVFCVGCGKEGRYVCARCLVFLGEASLVCPVCEESTFTGQTHEACKGRYTLDGLIGMWEYEGIIKEVLLQIKYRGIAHAVQETMEHAFLAMAKDTARFSSFLSFLLEPATALTFVPMWKRKERKRGHNQAALVAQALGAIISSFRDSSSGSSTSSLCAKTPRKFLQKIKDTKSQTELKEEERLWNVKDSFRYHADGRGLIADDRGYSISGNQQTSAEIRVPQKAVLVDDIWTSGATMRECAKVLKKAGVEKVWGFTLARTV